jgi:hypothetical protein
MHEVTNIQHNTKTKQAPDFDAANFDAAAWIKEQWRTTLITEEPPEKIPLIFINGTTVATPENHSLIIGKKKSRKTLLLAWLVGQYPGDISKDILFFDTEQGKRRVWKVQNKIKQLTGREVPIFSLRGKSREDRKRIIDETIRRWPTRPLIVIVDGIRDLVHDINKAEEVMPLIEWMESLLVEFDIHFMNVLHMNKNDFNARGMLGTELTNKCETVIAVEKDEKTELSKVYCESSRDEPFSEFFFYHDENGLPALFSGENIKGQKVDEPEMRARLKCVFDGEILRYSEVIKGIKIHFEVGDTKAEQLLGKFQRNGWIVRNGTPRAKDTVYKLMI